MNINEILTLKIEKMLYEGKSLSRYNNMPVFISGGCPEDVVKVKLTKINKNYLNAEIVEIIEESQYRVKPFCPLHNVCGSCDWQYIYYDKQLSEKKNIVYETIKKITKEEFALENTVPSPKIKEYRCKVQYPVSQTRVSKRILTGYYKKNTHEIINIKYCPIQPNIINIINEKIKEKLSRDKICAYNEKKHTGLLRHIVYRISSDEKQLLIIFVINDKKIPDELVKISREISGEYAQIKGICVNFNDKKTNVIMSDKTSVIVGSDYIIEILDNIKYKVHANSFFQINPESAINIFNKLKELITQRIKNPVILDAYSGVSSIGIWLSSIAKKVVSVEECTAASNDAKENAKLNNITNLEIINGDASKVFNNFIKENINFDVTIIDPPRKGSDENALNTLTQLTKKYLIYVSCNPTTLARDMQILINNGFKAEYIQPFDMFPNTYHVETVVLFKKQ